MSKGILLIACGPQHDALAARCINSIMRVSNLPIHVHREHNKTGFDSRFVKLRMNEITPFDVTLYLDCDTLVLQDPEFLVREFALSGQTAWMAVDPATPDSKRMVAHPFYKQKLNAKTLKALKALPGTVTHYNSGVILFDKGYAKMLFTIWRNVWSEGPKEEDEPALMLAMANKDWPLFRRNYIITLDPRWNMLCNQEKPDEAIRKGLRNAGIIHLCGLNKARNYDRINSLLRERAAGSSLGA